MNLETQVNHLQSVCDWVCTGTTHTHTHTQFQFHLGPTHVKVKLVAVSAKIASLPPGVSMTMSLPGGLSNSPYGASQMRTMVGVRKMMATVALPAETLSWLNWADNPVT